MPTSRITKPAIESPFLTVVECAALLGVSRRQLDRLLDLGDAPPHFRLGSRIRFRKDAVLSWAASREQTAVAS